MPLLDVLGCLRFDCVIGLGLSDDGKSANSLNVPADTSFFAKLTTPIVGGVVAGACAGFEAPGASRRVARNGMLSAQARSKVEYSMSLLSDCCGIRDNGHGRSQSVAGDMLQRTEP
jgi:hypothetical protein